MESFIKVIILVLSPVFCTNAQVVTCMLHDDGTLYGPSNIQGNRVAVSSYYLEVLAQLENDLDEELEDTKVELGEMSVSARIKRKNKQKIDPLTQTIQT